MENLYSALSDYEKEHIDFSTFSNRVEQNEIIVLTGMRSSVAIGNGLGLKFNSSIGLNSSDDYLAEQNKIIAVSHHKTHPHMMMDLSTIGINKPLYKSIQEIIGCPVGTVPYYTCFDPVKGIDDTHLLETIEEQAENGVSFMTLHLAANLDLASKTLCRDIPIISRGGSLLLRDQKTNHRSENILQRNLEKIILILKKHKVTVSIGTTFRPSTQNDALDNVHQIEIIRQKELGIYLKQQGVQIMMEGIGHISFNKIPEFVALLRKNLYIPFMPLGPIVSDRTNGQDHITSSIGACYIASLGGADIINAVTREEHTGGIPSIHSILEAIDAAASVVKIVDECRFPSFFQRTSAHYHNCLGTSQNTGCTRCSNECPFIWNEQARAGK